MVQLLSCSFIFSTRMLRYLFLLYSDLQELKDQIKALKATMAIHVEENKNLKVRCRKLEDVMRRKSSEVDSKYNI